MNFSLTHKYFNSKIYQAEKFAWFYFAFSVLWTIAKEKDGEGNGQ